MAGPPPLFEISADARGDIILRQPRCRTVVVTCTSDSRWLSLRDDCAIIRVALRGTCSLDDAGALRLLLAHQAAAVTSLRGALSLFAVLQDPDEPMPVTAGQTTMRHIAILRTADALALGARQRDIAAMLVGQERVAAEWRGESDSLRLSARRLIATARIMQSGGWRRLVARKSH